MKKSPSFVSPSPVPAKILFDSACQCDERSDEDEKQKISELSLQLETLKLNQQSDIEAFNEKIQELTRSNSEVVESKLGLEKSLELTNEKLSELLKVFR